MKSVPSSMYADQPRLLATPILFGSRALASERTRMSFLPKRTRALWVNLPLPGACLRYCTSEIAPTDAERTSFVLRGDMGTRGEIAFDRRVRLTLDEQHLPLEQREETWVATYPHSRHGRRLVVGNPG